MQPSLQGISEKAKRLKDYRFRDLYRMLNTEMLTVAWKHINKRASAGIDKVTAEEFSKDLRRNIETIVDNLKMKRYKAKLVRRVYIPKGKGKTRPLGIPTVSDKLVQIVVAWILMAIYEQDFMRNSYGYRQRTGAKEAARDLTKEIQFGAYNHIVEADIKGYFDSINHDWLIKMLEQRIDDKAFIRLIRKWLKAGILETDGKVIHPDTGTPQGGIVSPVLANIYLHYALDIWFEKKFKPRCQGKATIYRYADDFVCAFQYEADAGKFYHGLGERLKKFGLELSEEKTNIIRFSKYAKGERERFEFLGFEFRRGISRKGKRIVKRRTSPKRLTRAVKRITEWCKITRHMNLKQKFEQLNVKLIGHYNYYGVIGNYKSMNQFLYQTKRSLFKWLNRRSQRKSFNWEKFDKLVKRYGMKMPRITERINRQVKFKFRFA